jgi:hypothetical protein
VEPLDRIMAHFDVGLVPPVNPEATICDVLAVDAE